jgi:hypothetical protein
LAASLSEVVPIEDLADRIRSVFGLRPELGLVPVLEAFPTSGSVPSALVAALDVAGNSPYGPHDPLVRILSIEDPPHLIFAAHHAILDGLGLLSLLGASVESKIETDVRGLPFDRPVRRRFLPTAVGRIAEAFISPPSTVSSVDGDAGAAGDWLLSRPLDGPPPSTPALAAAVVRAVRSWNRSRSEPADRIVLAIGASLRPGSDLLPERRSAYLRVKVEGGDVSGLASAIRAAPIESDDSSPTIHGLTQLFRPIVRLVSPRLGSTALVSSLGRVSAPSILRDIHFLPVAHGRSALTVGMSGVGDRTVVTVRCPRRRFAETAAQLFAEAIVTELGRSDESG